MHLSALSMNLFRRLTIKTERRSQIDKALKSFKPRSSLSLGEVLALFATLSSVSLRAIHLYNRGPANVIFLLQPCHLYAFTLCTLPLLPQRSFLPHFLFNVMIYILWGAMLAVIFPDLRDYAQLFELENFWIEHALVLILPIYFVVTKKYQLFPFSLSFAFTSWVAFALYHSAILCTAALTVGKNLNYMLAPPPGPLEYFGDAYRAVMFTFCIFLTAIFGGIYTTICRLALELFSKFGSPKKTPQKLKSSKKAN